jgi:hypothetical protein
MEGLVHSIADKAARALNLQGTNMTLAKAIISEFRKGGKSIKEYKDFETGNYCGFLRTYLL